MQAEQVLNGGMNSVARFIIRRSTLILVITGLLSLLAILMLFRMSFNADVASFLLEGNETGEEFAALQEKYETTDPINVMASLPEGESYTTSANAALLARLRDTLSDVEGVEAVASVVPETNPTTGQRLAPEAVAAAPNQLIARAIGQNPLADLLMSENGQHTLLIVKPGNDPTATASRIIDVTADGLELTFSGNPVVWASVLDLLTWFLLILPPLVIALLVLVFFSTIGDLRLSAMAIMPAGLGSLWTFGVIFAFGTRIDIVTVIVPIFVIVMGSADGLHFVTHFQEQSESTDDPVRGVRSALSDVGVPMILTTVSTAAGFLALMATDVQPIRQLGLFTSVGIVLAGIVSFFSLPALMSRLTIKPKHRKALIGNHLTGALKSAVRTRVPAIVIMGLIFVFSVWALPQLAVNPDQLFFFKDDDPVRIAFERTEELFGGATPLMGEFEFDPQDPLQSLENARSATHDLEALPGVRTVFSVAGLADTVSTDQITGDTDLPIGRMVTEDGLRFILLPSSFTTDDLGEWLAYADATDTVTILTGMPVVWDEIARLVLSAQVVSLGVAYVLVTAMLLIAYRSIRETLVALVPITLTLATMLGFIAVSGIQLNLLTAVISSIVIGVGIDYSIHYIAAITIADEGQDGYVLQAIDKAGRPIMANALGIAVALSALWLSPLKIHLHVSQIMWVAMITAAVTTLVCIPAFLPRRAVKNTS
jgi:predicted RND superfamily exporter protein